MVDAKLFTTDFSNTEAALKSIFGGMVTCDWKQSLIARGFGWNVTVGSLSTGIVGGGAGTVLDLDQPEFILSIPSGTCLIPLDMRIQCTIAPVTTDSHVYEALIAVDKTQAVVDDGTYTAETAVNLRTNGTSTTCPVTCRSAYTADVTDPVLSYELARKEKMVDIQGTAATANLYEFELVYVPEFFTAMICGPAMVVGYWGGSIATTGYAQLNFLAVPSNLVTALS